MDIEAVRWVFLAVVILLVILLSYSDVKHILSKGLKNKKERDRIRHEIEKATLELFLYAEKQKWTGPEKMAYVAKNLYRLVPSVMTKYYTEENLAYHLQKMYDLTKKKLENLEDNKDSK